MTEVRFHGKKGSSNHTPLSFAFIGPNIETKDYLEAVDQLPDHKLPEAAGSLDVLEALCGPRPLKNPFDGSDCLGLNSVSRTQTTAHNPFLGLKVENVRCGG